MGEFTVSVWTDPEPLRVGTVHVTVAIARGNEAILNQAVRVEADGERGRVEAAATHDNSANKFLYEADMEIGRSGAHQFTVTINDIPDTLQFTATVEGESVTQSPLIIGGAIFLVAIVAMAGLWRGRTTSE